MSAVAPPPPPMTVWPPLPPLLPLPPPPSGDLPKATLIGLGVGVGLGGIFVLVGLGFFLIMRKKKLSWDYFCGGSPLEDKDNPYGGSPQKFAGLPKATPPGVASKLPLSPLFVPSPSALLLKGSVKSLSSPSCISVGFSHGTFTYEELAMATDGFSSANLLGQGGFGYVHKGVLPNGKVVAIKQLKAGSVQGEREFQAEVEIIGRVHHRHLVSLLGYSVAGAQRMLVYEFVPNNTLEFHLFGKGKPTMNWPTRMKIALGSAKGIAYLHEDCQPKIIHRDIKSSNILLDFDYEPKVADFGLAKFYLDTETHVSTRVMGTVGYVAPEYASSGKLTEKSDVFSFGVVLLMLITGRRPIDTTYSFTDDSMIDWARPLLTEALETGKVDALVDAKLNKDYDSNEMTRIIACAAACVRHSARLRPQMGQIVRALEGNISLDHLHEGMIPGYSTVYSPGSSDHESNQYKEDLKKSKKMALENQEQGSQDCIEPISETRLLPSLSSSERSYPTDGTGKTNIPINEKTTSTI